MESYVINGQTVTHTTGVFEGNSMIMRKGRATLLSAKVMLFALLNLENRDEKQYDPKELQYYRKLTSATGVDYSKGIVSEIEVADLRKVLKREKSGSFYSSLKELFSIDPYEPKSLRNSWAVMMPDADSGVLGYAEIIASTHLYDSKVFIKFNNEKRIRDQIFRDKEKCTELPFLYMQQQCRSIHSFRLFEILWYQISKADAVLRAQGDQEPQGIYSFRFELGELQLMLGIIDLTMDREGKRMASSSKNPNYNEIAELCNKSQAENMHDYRAFRRYSLDVAINEINANATSAFTVEYDVEKEERTNKVAAVVFHVTKKDAHVVPTTPVRQQNPIPNQADFIVELARELSNLALSYDDLCKIAETSNYNIEIVRAAYSLHVGMGITESFVNWFADFRK